MATTCQASSSYDLTLQPAQLSFDRPQPAPFHVEVHDGQLRTDGAPVALRAEDQDRLALFERELRALAPRAKAVARNGVDLLAQAVREEAANLGLGADTMAELNRRLQARVAELKQRIDASNSTRDWQGDLAEQYANQIAGDLLPVLAGDLGQQAIQAAMSGDMQAAAQLRDRASDLATQLRPRLERRMQALRPQIQALCPSIHRLAELQQGVAGSDGRPLNLLQIAQ
jgi:DNA repair exonuclease SbcCD ATPase subunit